MLNSLSAAAAVFLVVWMLGFGLHILGGFVHVLLVFAVVSALVHMVVSRRRSGAGAKPLATIAWASSSTRHR
jgi:Family of unknown function (DUF5670)